MGAAQAQAGHIRCTPSTLNAPLILCLAQRSDAHLEKSVFRCAQHRSRVFSGQLLPCCSFQLGS